MKLNCTVDSSQPWDQSKCPDLEGVASFQGVNFALGNIKMASTHLVDSFQG